MPCADAMAAAREGVEGGEDAGDGFVMVMGEGGERVADIYLVF